MEERKLTDKEERIAQSLPDKEFKKRYGKDWKSVKIATATKMAKMKEAAIRKFIKEQIKTLAETSDVMIIIGSFTSANSKRLTQLSLDRNPNSYQVTGKKDLILRHFRASDAIALATFYNIPILVRKNLLESFQNTEKHAYQKWVVTRSYLTTVSFLQEILD